MSTLNLNSRQIEAVRHEGSPLLIIAGAGTGKTTVITERIKWLIEKKGLRPEEILALTFTEKAADEMEERVDVALPMGFTQTWIMTFHSFCERVLRSDAVQIGLDPGFSILSEAETQMFIKEHLFEFNLDYFRPKGNPTKFISALTIHFSRLRDEDISPDQYIDWISKYKLQITSSKQEGKSRPISQEDVEKYEELAVAYKQYENLKVKHSVMDFADLISNTLRLFRERPNVLRSYQEKFRHILIDEFQDTNYAQNHLAVILTGDNKNITAVADDDQSIYRWRGAAVYNVMDFEKHFPNSKIVVLTKNYRSSQKILDHAYTLIRNNNPDRLEVKASINKKLIASNPQYAESDSRLAVIWEETVEDEAEQVVSEIKRLTSKKDSVQYSDIAILVRANDHAQPFVRELKRQGIPFQFLGPGRLFKQDEVKDLIAYARALVDLDDSHAMYRTITSSVVGLSGRDVQWLVTKSRELNLSLFRTVEEFLNSLECDEPEEIWKNHGVGKGSIDKLQKLLKMMYRHMDRIPSSSPGEILYYFLEDSGQLVRMRDPESEKEQRRVENISLFFNKIKTYEIQHPESKLNDFVDYLSFLMNVGESPLASQVDWSNENAVNILTVHSAKGLEFDTVFLVNLVNLRFPTTNRKEKIPLPEALIREPEPEIDPHIGEERRLFYVGMTRAKRNLYFTGAKFYHDSTNSRPKKMSPFIKEALGSDLDSYILHKAIDKPQNDSGLGVIEGFKSSPQEQEELPLVEDRKINYLSYSRIESFLTCPLHYKLEYILKIPSLPSASLSFGNAVHNALRDAYKMLLAGNVEKDASKVVELALEYYKMHWSPIGFINKKQEKERFNNGEEIIRGFIESDLSRKFSVFDLEKPFEFNLTSDLRIGGRIDRIDRLADNTIEIIDYKTGKVPKKPELKRKKLQLAIYAMAGERVFDWNLDDILLTFYYLEHDEKITVRYSAEELDMAKEEIMDVRRKMEKSDFECNHSFYCTNGCDYQLFCN